jgi:hypothetical protein
MECRWVTQDAVSTIPLDSQPKRNCHRTITSGNDSHDRDDDQVAQQMAKIDR